jgi:hypothetical protein
MTATSSERASGARMGSGAALPKVGGSSGTAPLKNNNYALLQVVLFWAGAILLPTGIVIIILGWYGAANTQYLYDQIAFLASGGFLGLGLTFAGGFLYFGAWLARIASDNRESNKRLADTLLVLADVTSRTAASHDTSGGLDMDAIAVTAGDGTTMHRRDCSLVAHRDDLRPVGNNADSLTACRVCRP